MSDNELRDKIAKVHFAKAAELAAVQIGLDEPVRWEDLTDLDRSNCRASAQAIIDDLGLIVIQTGGEKTLNSRTGKVTESPIKTRVVSNRWEKQ